MEQFDLSQLTPMIVIGLIFYFFMIRPQIKQQKKMKLFIGGLKEGQAVITEGGIHGKITSVDNRNDTCVIETLSGKMRLEKSKISLHATMKLQQEKEKS